VHCDGVVCCIGCMSFIPGFIKRVVSEVAFMPPRPAGYHISESGEAFLLADLDTCTLDPLPNPPAEGVRVEVARMKTKKGNTIYGFHFRRLDSGRTVLFSHANSTDIGIMFAHSVEICQKLRVDVFAYEYSGYGQSTGTPSEKDIYADIDAAFEYLVDGCAVRPERLICYGQSIGSAPTLDLASRQPVGGLVLHSALKSGLGIIRDVGTTHWFDVFQNAVKIKSVRCPVFIIHGTADMEVPLEHGLALFEACPKELRFEPWWVQDGGHNDIEIIWRSAYFRQLQRFFETLGVTPATEREELLAPALPPQAMNDFIWGEPTANEPLLMVPEGLDEVPEHLSL